MDGNTVLPAIEAVPSSHSIDPHSLFALFAQLPDGRQARGRRYPLPLLLTLVVAARLAGQPTLSGGAHWVRLRREWLRQHLPEVKQPWPCATTSSQALARVSAEMGLLQVQHFLQPSPPHQQAQAKRGQRHLAIDGRTLRGTVGPTRPSHQRGHLLTVYDLSTGGVLAQGQVGQQENASRACVPLLKSLPLSGCVVTAEALHTQRAFCRQVRKANGDSVLMAKDHHSKLRGEMALWCEDQDAWQHWLSTTESTKQPGRFEVRQLSVSADLKAYLAPDWDGGEQVFRLERTITTPGATRQEVVYGCIRLPASLASPATLNRLVRQHWWIENRLHWRRDVTLGAAHCQAHTGHPPQVLAVLHTLILALLDRPVSAMWPPTCGSMPLILMRLWPCSLNSPDF